MPPKKIQATFIEKYLLPQGIEDRNLLAALHNSLTSYLISIAVFALVVPFWLYLEMTPCLIITAIFMVTAFIAVVAMRLGYYEFSRYFYLLGMTGLVVSGSMFLGIASFFWIYLVNGMITSFFNFSATEAKKQKAIMAIFGSGFIFVFFCYAINLFPYPLTARQQELIIYFGVFNVFYSMGLLLKAVVRYQREVVLYKEMLQAQSLTLLQQAKMSSLGEMAGGVAHEINNPLGVIFGHATHLVREIQGPNPSTEKILGKAEKIMTMVTRISKIVSALRTFSRSADNDPFQNCRFSEIVEDTLNFCNENLKSNHIEVRISGPQDLHIDCRPTQISQVLISLINNSFDAIKALPEKWIEISVENRQGSLMVIFTDSGKGIPEAIAEKIMQPFFTTKEVGKGTGLGLSVSKGIIEDHGGSLKLDASCANTRFVIELPTHQTQISETKVS